MISWRKATLQMHNTHANIANIVHISYNFQTITSLKQHTSSYANASAPWTVWFGTQSVYNSWFYTTPTGDEVQLYRFDVTTVLRLVQVDCCCTADTLEKQIKIPNESVEPVSMFQWQLVLTVHTCTKHDPVLILTHRWSVICWVQPERQTQQFQLCQYIWNAPLYATAYANTTPVSNFKGHTLLTNTLSRCAVHVPAEWLLERACGICMFTHCFWTFGGHSNVRWCELHRQNTTLT
jgi:hypothetical protein